MRIQRVLIVNRKSLHQLYVIEHKEPAVQQAIRRGDRAALSLKESHQTQQRALEHVHRTLDRLGIESVTRWRGQFRSTRNVDLVLSFGGDGTLLDTSHRVLDETPVMGINSDSKRSVGALSCGTAKDLPRLLELLMSGKLRPQKHNRIRLRVDGEQVLCPALNDVLFAHVSPAGMSRFDLAIFPERKALEACPESKKDAFVHHRSSGLWVATATGATAAIHSAGGQTMPPLSRRLQFLVRDPFVPSGSRRPRHTRGFVGPGKALVLISRVRRGMIWVDGVGNRLAVSYGQQIVLDNHPMPLRLIRCP